MYRSLQVVGTEPREAGEVIRMHNDNSLFIRKLTVFAWADKQRGSLSADGVQPIVSTQYVTNLSFPSNLVLATQYANYKLATTS